MYAGSAPNLSSQGAIIFLCDAIQLCGQVGREPDTQLPYWFGVVRLHSLITVGLNNRLDDVPLPLIAG